MTSLAAPVRVAFVRQMNVYTGCPTPPSRGPRLVLQIQRIARTTPDDRVSGPSQVGPCPPSSPNTRKASITMLLQADKKVLLSVTGATDEVGNPVDVPLDAEITWQTDNTEVLNLLPGDTSLQVWAAATGVTGDAIVKGLATFNGQSIETEPFLVTVVAGDAVRLTVTAGEPVEVTPDEPVEPPVVL